MTFNINDAKYFKSDFVVKLQRKMGRDDLTMCEIPVRSSHCRRMVMARRN